MPHPTFRAATASLLAWILAAFSCADPSSATAADNEARLVGAWQKDLSPQLAQLPPEQRQRAARAGLLGAVMVYQAGELAVSVNLMGKPMDMRLRLQWQGEQIVMRELSSGAADSFGRYDGPLPPAC